MLHTGGKYKVNPSVHNVEMSLLSRRREEGKQGESEILILLRRFVNLFLSPRTDTPYALPSLPYYPFLPSLPSMLPPVLPPRLPPSLPQVLAKLSSFIDPSSLHSSIQPCLQNLVSSDPDGDVRFYSALALGKKEEATLTAAAPAAVDNSDAAAAASALAAAVAAAGGVGVEGMG